MFERKLLKGRLPSQKNSRKAFPFVTRRNEAFPKPPPPKSTAFVKIAEPLVKRMDVNWIAVLVHCEDGKNFEIVGNAFKITASVSDAHASAAPLCEGSTSACFASEMLLHASRGCQVDDLKEAVRSEAVCFGSLSVLV